MSLEGFNPQEVIERVQANQAKRFDRLKSLPDTDKQAMLDFLFRMIDVAASLVMQEGHIQVPGSTQNIAYTPESAEHVMGLFATGLSHAMLKTWEMGIDDELKTAFLQNVAQQAYESAKQVFLSTYGQEDTPKAVQISVQQQTLMMQQTAESALMFYVSEHEKSYGSIPMHERLLDDMGSMDDLLGVSGGVAAAEAGVSETVLASMHGEDDDMDEAWHPESAVASPIASPKAPPVDHLPTEPQTVKLIALGLLLSTLPAEDHPRLLGAFPTSDQQAILYYCDPQHLPPSVDMQAVIHALRDLKHHVVSRHTSASPGGVPQAPSTATLSAPLQTLLANFLMQAPAEVLLQWAAKERVGVQAAVLRHMPLASVQPLLQGADRRLPHLSAPLPILHAALRNPTGAGGMASMSPALVQVLAETLEAFAVSGPYDGRGYGAR